MSQCALEWIALSGWRSRRGAEALRPKRRNPHRRLSGSHVHELKMFYESRGDGPVLVLLHGGLASIPVWQEALDFFSQHFRVIAPEQMGHGRTDQRGEPQATAFCRAAEAYAAGRCPGLHARPLRSTHS